MSYSHHFTGYAFTAPVIKGHTANRAYPAILSAARLTSVFAPILLFLLLFSGCRHHPYEEPGPPLIYLSLNGVVENSGMLKVGFQGNNFVSYARGVADSCINLTGTARYRKPLIIDQGPKTRFFDYDGFSFVLWVKMAPDDNHEYTIAGQRLMVGEDSIKGWRIRNGACGAWRWEFSDGSNALRYEPSATGQPINDGDWHQIGFAVNYSRREARFYFDGINRAVLSLEGLELSSVGVPIFLGADPLADDPKMETFNGCIDEVGVWSKPLSDAAMAELYHRMAGKKVRAPATSGDSLTIMSWNIWHGGRHEGRQVGVERVIEIIRQSGADIVSMQETYGSGEMIADALGYHFYLRSSNLSVLSRFPIVKSYNTYKPFNFGAVQLKLDDDMQLIVCPVWLNYLPNTGAYVMSGKAVADTIEMREMETRGTEIQFILSEIQPFIRNSNQVPVVMAGDFNSGSHFDWTARNRELYQGLEVGFPVSMAMAQKGFADSYRALHPDEVTHPGQTWSPVFKETLQDRIDYIYYKGERLLPLSSRVIDTHPLGFPSDHAAVVTSFKLREPF